jgi:hypothetical protein
MKSRLFCQPESREDRLNVASTPASTAYSPRFLSSVQQVAYPDLPAHTEARFNLSTNHDGPKTLTNLLSESVSETLTELVGSHAREAIYDYMERKHSVSRDEIPEHLDSLFTVLEDTFGVEGKKVIGRIIAEKVYAKLDWEFESFPNLEFADYMERIKTKITNEESE